MKTLSLAVASLVGLVNPVVNPPESKLYPFVGQKACKEALQSNSAVQQSMLAVLFHSQTIVEQEKKDTVEKNRIGFMSSHAKEGTRLGAILASGEELSVEDAAKAGKLVQSYSRQMSVVLRNFAMSEDPTLAVVASKFSIPV